MRDNYSIEIIVEKRIILDYNRGFLKLNNF